MSGSNNPFYGKGPGQKALDKAAELSGTKVYVYDQKTSSLINVFRSIRDTVKHMPIRASTLPKYLDTGKPFKGYCYYTKEQK